MAVPSVHPETGRNYRFLDHKYSPKRIPMPALCPPWVLGLRPVEGARSPVSVSSFILPARAATHSNFDRSEVLAAIPDKIGLARSWGIRIAGRTGQNGWAPCHAIDREDIKPSAAIHFQSGHYVDRGSGTKLSLFDLGIKLGVYRDFHDAISKPRSTMCQGIRTVKIDLFHMTPETQPRVRINEEVVEEYAESVRTGKKLPPVTAYKDDENMIWLADGWHRVHAYRKAGLEEINTNLLKGSKRDAVLFAVGANTEHGQRRTNADKRRAIETMLADKEWGRWSNGKIAQQCAVSDHFVGTVRAELTPIRSESSTEREGRDGRTIKTDKIGSPKLATINGHAAPDPPDVAKARANGKIPATAVVEVHEPEEITDLADVAEEIAETAAQSDDELSNDDWLATLPLSSKLKGSQLKTFSRDALAYRELEKPRPVISVVRGQGSQDSHQQGSLCIFGRSIPKNRSPETLAAVSDYGERRLRRDRRGCRVRRVPAMLRKRLLDQMTATLFADEKTRIGELQVSLRPYQDEAIDAIRAEFIKGIKSTLLVLPTGTGKTITFGVVARRTIERGGRVLILAHRDELIQQAVAKLDLLGIDAGIEKAEQQARSIFSPDCVVASVATMQRKRLTSWPRDHFRLISLPMKAHHAGRFI